MRFIKTIGGNLDSGGPKRRGVRALPQLYASDDESAAAGGTGEEGVMIGVNVMGVRGLR